LGTNVDKMIHDAKKINPDINIITTSAKNGINIDKLISLMHL
jgi:Ni2+-binding GTPase involved in maturation of urease and hydrogenase